jgi:hypothetical protein
MPLYDGTFGMLFINDDVKLRAKWLEWVVIWSHETQRHHLARFLATSFVNSMPKVPEIWHAWNLFLAFGIRFHGRQ